MENGKWKINQDTLLSPFFRLIFRLIFRLSFSFALNISRQIRYSPSGFHYLSLIFHFPFSIFRFLLIAFAQIIYLFQNFVFFDIRNFGHDGAEFG